jgi:hypothetical protein
MTHPSLGYLHDHPAAIAARTNPRNWDAGLLLATRAALPVPDDFDIDLGPTLDQDGVGACVAFAATEIRQAQEHLDEGGWPFSTASGFKAYDWLKHGHGAYPGDGIPTVEGSFPLEVWKMARQVGVPATDGAGRLIEAFYQVLGTPGSADWFDAQIQLLLGFGALSIASAWPTNWWTCPSSGLLPFPSGVAGGHMYVRKGFRLKGPVGSLSSGRSPSGRYWRHRQSWGAYGATDEFGRSGEFLLPFEADAGYPNLQIGEAWKTIDKRESPFPPPPTPGGTMLIQVDHTARLVETTVGKPLYAADGTTLITPIQSLPPDNSLASAAAYGLKAGDPASYYAVLISWRNVPQAAWIKATDCTKVTPLVADPVALKAAYNEGVEMAAEAARTAHKP